MLRMSNLGTKCMRQLWYKINQPELGEPLDASARLKFLFGDIIEEILLLLAKEAGHTVTGEQDELEINGVKGHRDAIIDGLLTDVKSASSYSFKKFDQHLETDQDAFGYLDQLNAYLYASHDDPLVEHKNSAAFFVMDKTLGHLTLDVHPSNGVDYSHKVEEIKELMSQGEPPAKGFSDVEHGKKGNRKLGMECGYCAFKHSCWPNLRTFLYSNRPEHLTVVKDLPRVYEVER